MTTSCAAFLEMLGQDSTALRVDLSAARRIIDSSTQEAAEDSAMWKEERKRSIGEIHT